MQTLRQDALKERRRHHLHSLRCLLGCTSPQKAAPPTPDDGLVREAQFYADLLHKLMDEKPYSKQPWARTALAVGAEAILRGRLWTDKEKLQNLMMAMQEAENVKL